MALVCFIAISGALNLGIQLMLDSMLSAEGVGESWDQKVRKRGCGREVWKRSVVSAPSMK